MLEIPSPAPSGQPPSPSARPAACAAPGAGRLAVARVAGQSAVVGCASTSPLRLFTPRPRGHAVWAVATTHGGGLVAGDTLDVAVEVGRGARALLGTQSHTRVYRSTGAVATQLLSAHVDEGAVLAVLPEPTVCFAGARLEQVQRFDVAEGGSLLLLDAVAEGRAARGERWDFTRYAARNEVVLGGRLALADAVRLEDLPGLTVRDRMRGAALLATVVAVGPALQDAAARLLDELAATAADAGADVHAAASPLAGGVHLRLAAATVAAGLAFLRRALAFATPLLGGAALERRP